MAQFIFPIVDEQTVVRDRNLSKYAKHQDRSAWTCCERDGFTAAMYKHFASMMPPQTAGVTLQVAAKHGTL